MTFRGTLYGYPPSERAEGAQQRALRAYARNPNPRLRVRVTNDGAQVIADRSILFHVVHADVNSLAGETPESRAEEAVAQLALVLSERQARSDPKALGIAIGLSLLATVAWLLLLRAVRWLDHHAGRRTPRGRHRKSPPSCAPSAWPCSIRSTCAWRRESWCARWPGSPPRC